MLSGISNPFGTDMQAASAVICTSLGLLAGRKFCLAAGCKLVGTLESLTGMQNAAEWHQAGDEYMVRARKDAFRDVAVVAAFVAAVGFARYAEESFTGQTVDAKSEEPGYFQGYVMPTLKYGTVFGIGVGLEPAARKLKGTHFAAFLNDLCISFSTYPEGKGIGGGLIRNAAWIGGLALNKLPGDFPTKKSNYF